MEIILDTNINILFLIIQVVVVTAVVVSMRVTINLLTKYAEKEFDTHAKSIKKNEEGLANLREKCDREIKHVAKNTQQIIGVLEGKILDHFKEVEAKNDEEIKEIQKIKLVLARVEGVINKN